MFSQMPLHLVSLFWPQTSMPNYRAGKPLDIKNCVNQKLTLQIPCTHTHSHHCRVLLLQDLILKAKLSQTLLTLNINSFGQLLL